MDLVLNCKETIDEILKKLEPLIEDDAEGAAGSGWSLQTQNIVDLMPVESDKNLGRILEQQSHLKMIIDRDEQTKMLRRSIMESISTVERLRRTCSTIATNALKERQSDMRSHAEMVSKM